MQPLGRESRAARRYDRTVQRPLLRDGGVIAAENGQTPDVGVGHRKNSILDVMQRAEPAGDKWRTEPPGRKRKRRRVAALQKGSDSQLLHTFYEMISVFQGTARYF